MVTNSWRAIDVLRAHRAAAAARAGRPAGPARHRGRGRRGHLARPGATRDDLLAQTQGSVERAPRWCRSAAGVWSPGDGDSGGGEP
jgi:hypothetical protein